MRSETGHADRRRTWHMPGLALGAASLLLLAGCGHRRAIEQVKGYTYGGTASPLAQAYAELLLAPVWDRVFVEPEDFIRVRGRISGTETVLEVYYDRGEEPPRVSFFLVDGRRRAGREFPSFLQRTLLCRALQSGPAAVPTPAAAPSPTPAPPPTAPPEPG